MDDVHTRMQTKNTDKVSQERAHGTVENYTRHELVSLALGSFNVCSQHVAGGG